MEALTIEIINPKALKLIKVMQELNLIKISEEPSSNLKVYLKKMRSNSNDIPSLESITQLVEEVRIKSYELS